MQRRNFLRKTGLAGAAALASLHLPALARVDLAVGERLHTSLLAIGAGPGLAPAPAHYRGPVQVRVAGIETDQVGRRVDLRAWFSADRGPSAFEFASTGRQGASASLRFRVDAERLLGFAASVAGAEACADCNAAEASGGRLAPGAYWLLVHADAAAPARPDQAGVVARLRLDVSALDVGAHGG